MLNVSKRFEFSASHKYENLNWTDQTNQKFFGKKAGGKYGHGHNYVVWFMFGGKIDNRTGMIINVTRIKEIIEPFLKSNFDHKYLNQDTPPFDKLNPTPENIVKFLFDNISQLFRNEDCSLEVCHLIESATSSATVYAKGKVEKHNWLSFSAARRTFSPHLSDRENEELFGRAASPLGHGHNYKLKVTLEGEIDPEHGMIVPDNKFGPVLKEIFDELDHKNLNSEIDGLRNEPITTEILAKYIFEKLSSTLPVSRVKLFENDNYFVEYHADKRGVMGITQNFSASHRLYSDLLSPDENEAIYGKCHNPSGHGHDYKLECSLRGKIDNKTGILFDLRETNNAIAEILEQYDYKHLNLETDDFKSLISTGENIVSVLHRKLKEKFGNSLFRLRLWETANNKFTFRGK